MGMRCQTTTTSEPLLGWLVARRRQFVDVQFRSREDGFDSLVVEASRATTFARVQYGYTFSLARKSLIRTRRKPHQSQRFARVGSDS
jgi:hypothetical protein